MMNDNKILDENVEHCWVLIGVSHEGTWCARAEYLGKGEPASVNFDPYFAMGLEKQIIGFLHTHPSFPAIPSNVDDGTMTAWTISFGRPLLCAIKGIDGLRAYWYNDEDLPEECSIKEFEGMYFGKFLQPK
jgi:hypothetical protein